LCCTGPNSDGKLGLVGSLPSSLAGLKNLQSLILAYNSLKGTIPSGLCSPLLRVVALGSNHLTGNCLQQLLNCSGLTSLELYRNDCSGTLPDMAEYSWTQVTSLDVSSNSYEGTLPKAFYRLTAMRTFYAADNK
jgi:hypothetical protein